MNPANIRTQADLMKVREAYLANLEAEQRNLQKTIDAVSILKQTGRPPIVPQDTRTLSEKLMDIEKLKIALRRQLMTITDGQQTSQIMNSLSNDEVQALNLISGSIFPTLQEKFPQGVPAPLFLEYVRRYLKDFNKNMGLASGNQDVIVQEIKLTRDMLSRVLPSKPLLEELFSAVMSAPESNEKEQAILAVRALGNALPDINDITATQPFLSEVELSNLSSLITDALRTVPTANQVQKLSKDIINTLRNDDKKQTENILSKTFQMIQLEQDELEKLKSISEALRQEQEESLKPQVEKASIPESEILNVANIAFSRLKKINVGEPNEAVVLIPKDKITAVEIGLAKQILNIDTSSVDEIMESKFLKPALLTYFEYISKRDTGKPVPKEEMDNLKGLTRTQLKQLIVDMKTTDQSESITVPVSPRKPTKAQLRAAKRAEALQQTLVNVGGISAVDLEEEALRDFAVGKLKTPQDFVLASINDIETYLKSVKYGLDNLMFTASPEGRVELMKAYDDYFAAPHIDKQEALDLLMKIKQITGMGFKQLGKNIVRKGKNMIIGNGLVQKKSKPFGEKIDFTEGIPSDKSYVPFGKYVIHKHKLTGGILQIRTVKGGAIAKLPSLGISSSLGKIIKKIVGGSLPSYEEMSALTDDEKNTLYKVFKLSQVDKIDLLSGAPDKTKDEQDMNRFEILKGQIQSGNNNKDLVKEFKCMLIKFINGGKIPRGQGMDILCDLMALGY